MRDDDQKISVTVELSVFSGYGKVSADKVLGWFNAVVEGCQREAPSPLCYSEVRLKSMDIG